MFFAIPLWLKGIWFVLVNLPTIIAIIREIRKYNSDLSKADQKLAFDEMREDIEEFKETRNEKLLRNRMLERRDRFRSRRLERDARRGK